MRDQVQVLHALSKLTLAATATPVSATPSSSSLPALGRPPRRHRESARGRRTTTLPKPCLLTLQAALTLSPRHSQRALFQLLADNSTICKLVPWNRAASFSRRYMQPACKRGWVKDACPQTCCGATGYGCRVRSAASPQCVATACGDGTPYCVLAATSAAALTSCRNRRPLQRRLGFARGVLSLYDASPARRLRTWTCASSNTTTPGFKTLFEDGVTLRLSRLLHVLYDSDLEINPRHWSLVACSA